MYDVAIVGGGIVGLSVARDVLARNPHVRLVLLERESSLASHQTGHNSGVIHSGIYYAPGSLKARLARAGNESTRRFCDEHGIPYEVCGKVIVATEAEELPRLHALHKRGVENGLNVRALSAEKLREIEPHVSGLAAVQVPSAGIVSYKRICEAIAEELRNRGAEIRLKSGVVSARTLASSMAVETEAGTVEARLMVNCAGLQSDRVAAMAGISPPARIVPFRGDYYNLSAGARRLVRGLVYPVPNPDFPFLGVHLTKMIDGEVHAGPNAVLSLKREGYSKVAFDPRDAASALGYSGFWRLAAKNWREGVREVWRAASKSAFLASVQRLLPDIQKNDLIPATPGVRAQALMPDGKMVDDFLIVDGTHSLHVCNAPSPAATAGLEIGRFIGGKVIERLAKK